MITMKRHSVSYIETNPTTGLPRTCITVCEGFKISIQSSQTTSLRYRNTFFTWNSTSFRCTILFTFCYNGNFNSTCFMNTIEGCSQIVNHLLLLVQHNNYELQLAFFTFLCFSQWVARELPRAQHERETTRYVIALIVNEIADTLIRYQSTFILTNVCSPNKLLNSNHYFLVFSGTNSNGHILEKQNLELSFHMHFLIRQWYLHANTIIIFLKTAFEF